MEIGPVVQNPSATIHYSYISGTKYHYSPRPEEIMKFIHSGYLLKGQQ